jgi:hypothetical protein
MIELFQAVTTAYRTGMGHAAWYGEAKQSVSPPYGVISSPAISPEDTFSVNIDDVSIQINIYDVNSTDCFAKFAACKAIFDKATLAVTSHYAVVLTRELVVVPVDVGVGDNKWMAVVGYNCLLQKT